MATHLVWLLGNRFDNSVCVCVYVYHLTMRKPHMLTTDMIEIIQAPNRDAKSSCQGRGEIFCRYIFWAVQGPMSVYAFRPITNSLNFNTVY